MIVDRAIYQGGKRIESSGSLSDLHAACERGDGIAWLGLYRPDAAEFADMAARFGLHPLAVEDAVNAHQRPKLEYYGDSIFLVLRPARYLEGEHQIELGEVHVFAGPHFVITVRHSETPDLAIVREKLESRPDLLARGPGAIVHAIVDRVVDDYEQVVSELQRDIDEIEDEVFDGSPAVSRRIYAITREVIALQRATRPLVPILAELIADPQVDDEEARYLRDVKDHAIRVQDDVTHFRDLLQNILDVNIALETKALSEAANRTNDDVKKISSWAAIFFAPTFIGTIYGMNFRHMPELRWIAGYPLAIAAMVLLSSGLYVMFRRRGWI